jgi:hypothetical protein
MRNSTSPRLTAAAAEDLLDGRGAPTRLRGLLAAAAAPGRAEELAGEAAARAAFATARIPGPSPSPEWIAPTRPIAGKLLAAKALALVVVAAGATGGVALAANSTLARPPVTAPPSTAAPRSPAVEHRTPTAPTSEPSVGPNGGPGAGPTPTATPTPTPTGAPRPDSVKRSSPDAKDTTAVSRGRSAAAACAVGSTAARCGPPAPQARPSGVDSTVSPPTPVAEAVEPVAAAPPAAPTATPTTEALTAAESAFVVRGQSDRHTAPPEPVGRGHD